jgi:hypothetical protein
MRSGSGKTDSGPASAGSLRLSGRTHASVERWLPTDAISSASTSVSFGVRGRERAAAHRRAVLLRSLGVETLGHAEGSETGEHVGGLHKCRLARLALASSMMRSCRALNPTTPAPGVSPTTIEWIASRRERCAWTAVTVAIASAHSSASRCLSCSMLCAYWSPCSSTAACSASTCAALPAPRSSSRAALARVSSRSSTMRFTVRSPAEMLRVRVPPSSALRCARSWRDALKERKRELGRALGHKAGHRWRATATYSAVE